MTRTVYRYVPHAIRHVPERGVAFEAFCVADGCGAGSGARDEEAGAQDWALGHSGRTGHDLFRRVVTDHARVTRDE
ncbi:DUF7848 domain-containing protein [Streptomyces atratus]|uniref:DUF7848 domain-containing protein n=1 Tax=Streptomyces atratus TaxID=1893 RepID=UPI0022580AAD|nr:hypothetical protein [Streptomyces atratus]MCX5341116.1 hypothetical protein [Streptomyces atratus]